MDFVYLDAGARAVSLIDMAAGAKIDSYCMAVYLAEGASTAELVCLSADDNMTRPPSCMYDDTFGLKRISAALYVFL